MPHKTLDLNEAADFLRMSPSALREKAKAGRILGAKPGKKWVFLEADLVAYVRSLYPEPRQALRVTTLKEVEACHSTSVRRCGGYDSPHPTADEYDVLLGLETGPRRRSTTIG